MECVVELKEKKICAEVTPDMHRCIEGGACPSVFVTNDETLLIVGKVLDRALLAQLPEGRVAEDELVIEVPKTLISRLGSL